MHYSSDIAQKENSVRAAWAEFWEHREVLAFLILRNLKIRYKETALGVLWVVLQPLLTVLTFTLFLGKLAPSDGLPYGAFVLTGVVPWFFFSNGIRQCAGSILGNTHLIQKVYFPRVIFPLACFASELVDFGVGLLLVLLTLPILGVVPQPHYGFLFLSLALLLITTIGVGFWLSALNAQFRDVGYLLPFATQLWFFSSPVIYSNRNLSSEWNAVYSLNPMMGAIESFRAALLSYEPSPLTLSISATVSLILFGTGLRYFLLSEQHFSDRV